MWEKKGRKGEVCIEDGKNKASCSQSAGGRMEERATTHRQLLGEWAGRMFPSRLLQRRLLCLCVQAHVTINNYAGLGCPSIWRMQKASCILSLQSNRVLPSRYPKPSVGSVAVVVVTTSSIRDISIRANSRLPSRLGAVRLSYYYSLLSLR